MFARLPDWRAVAAALVSEHEAVLRAIENGNGDMAAVLVAEHIRRFYQDQILES